MDKIALSCLSFSLLERGKPIAERACCTVTVVVGTDASGAAAVKAATSVAPHNPTCGADGLKDQGFSWTARYSSARASGWSHGGVGDAELRVPRLSRERRRPEMEGVVQKPSLGLTCVGALFLLAGRGPWKIIGRRF